MRVIASELLELSFVEEAAKADFSLSLLAPVVKLYFK